MISTFTNMVIKCQNKDLFWTFKWILTKLLYFWDLSMVTFFSSIIKIFLLLTQSNLIHNLYQISLIFQSDTILELIEMRFVNLNGMLTMNISYLEVKRDTVCFGNIKMKKLQLLLKIYKSQNYSIVERKELLDVTLFVLTARIHISSPVSWS